MKKIIYLSIIALLIGFSCKRKELSLEPGTLGSEVTKEKTLPTVVSVYTLDGDLVIEDYDTTIADIQDEIVIQFSEPMDENSVLSAVSIRVVGGKGPTVPSGTWVYEKESNRLRYTLSANAGYADSTKYEITISSNAQDLSGNPLDGNNNDLAEGSLDDYHITLWTNNGNTVPDPDYDPPGFVTAINLISPNPFALGGLVGTKDSVHVRFYTADIDRNTVQGAFHLYEYETNTEITLGTPDFVVDTPGNTTDIIFKGFTLNYSTVYKLVITTALKDTAGNSLDGNNNGYSESDEIDRVEILFVTFDQDSNMTDFPSWEDYQRNNTNRSIITIWFDELMDTSTINFTTLKVFKNYLQDAIPFTMRKWQNHQDKRTYIEITLLSNKTDPVYIWISRNVTDEEGLKLDSNGDNIGGIEGEDNEIFQVP